MKNRLGAKGGNVKKPVTAPKVGAGGATNRPMLKVTTGGGVVTQKKQNIMKAGGVKNRLGMKKTATFRSPISAPGQKPAGIRTVGGPQIRPGLKTVAQNRLGVRTTGPTASVRPVNAGNTTFKVTGLANQSFDAQQKIQVAPTPNQTFDMRQKLQKVVPNMKIQTVVPQSAGGGPFDARSKINQNTPKVDARQTLLARQNPQGLPTIKVICFILLALALPALKHG